MAYDNVLIQRDNLPKEETIKLEEELSKVIVEYEKKTGLEVVYSFVNRNKKSEVNVTIHCVKGK
jgi:hypothetical protein